MFGGLKNSRTFASLSKGSTSENRGFGDPGFESLSLR